MEQKKSHISFLIGLIVPFLLCGCESEVETVSRTLSPSPLPPSFTVVAAVSPTPSETASPTKRLLPTITPTLPPTLSGSGGGMITFIRTLENSWGIYVMNADGSNEQRIAHYRQAVGYPKWSPDGRRIAFHKHLSEDVWSIYVIDADGRNERRLTDTETRDAAPAWSPDGLQIAYTRDGDIWVMHSDGSDQRLLMDDPISAYGVDWSPDGSQIVFVSERDGNDEIYLINADGSNPIRLTNEEADDSWPVWSPARDQLAFTSNRDGDWEIYLMQSIGGSVHQLTDNDVDDTDPAWSPDGSRIAFSSNRLSGIPFDTEIFVMTADGFNPQQITHKSGFEWGLDWYSHDMQETTQEIIAATTAFTTVVSTPCIDAQTTMLSLSGNGAGTIAFDSDRDGTQEIYIMNTDGSTLWNQTNHPASDTDPDWSPDGSQITFPSNRNGNDEIYRMDVDGGIIHRLTHNPAVDVNPAWYHQRRLTNNKAFDGAPSWSPESMQLTFASDQDGNLEIYVMGIDGYNLWRLTYHQASDSDPVWQP